MKNIKLNIAVFIVAYLVFMIAALPAATVIGWVKLPANIRLGQVEGSVWHGKVSAVQLNNDVIPNVSWSLRVLPLFIGNLSGEVVFGKSRDVATISGSGYLSSNFAFDHVSAKDFTLRLPATQVIDRMHIGLPIKVTGRVLLSLKQFDQGKPFCEQLDGNVRWLKAGLIADRPLGLGMLEGDLACQKGEVELKVTKDNPLGLQMTTLVGANNKFSIKGFVKPSADMPTEVHNAVQQMLGQADSQGRFPLNF